MVNSVFQPEVLPTESFLVRDLFVRFSIYNKHVEKISSIWINKNTGVHFLKLDPNNETVRSIILGLV